ncbi:MAG: FecR domain-containing protein [Chitinophagaceae bacterium]
MESPERIWQLMARALNNEVSSVEQEELSCFLANDESLQQRFELLKRAWREEHDLYEDEDDAKAHISKIIYKAKTETEDLFIPSSRRRRRRRLVPISIALLIILAGTLFFVKKHDALSIDKEPLIAQKGSRTRSLLPDGSTVWLNAGSKLFFENDFTGKTREVRLEGEAFFDIVKNPSQPFIVHTSGIDIRVLGTAFNVKAYPEDANIETTLYRGLVQVFRQEDAAKTPIVLTPNEKLVLPRHAASVESVVSERKNELPVIKAAPAFTILSIDSSKKESERFETAWVYSRLEFRGENFEQLALKMERWFNVTISFADEKVKRLSFNGSFENETPDQALASLKEAIGEFDYKIQGNEILISSSK